ncbi:hypothetical protein [Bradyrhizobium sp.]|uniref:hypothetical protein n=1 Tax=Bradyrhizobium sp. TaxID=376 RepID=UPI0029BFC0B2|nr:hypothetical protein [Bradyrhizobium sp.]
MRGRDRPSPEARWDGIKDATIFYVNQCEVGILNIERHANPSLGIGNFHLFGPYQVDEARPLLRYGKKAMLLRVSRVHQIGKKRIGFAKLLNSAEPGIPITACGCTYPIEDAVKRSKKVRPMISDLIDLFGIAKLPKALIRMLKLNFRTIQQRLIHLCPTAAA